MTAPAYPLVNSPRSTIDCPLHGLAVALGDDGRIMSECPRCLREAVRARAKMRAAFPLKEKP